MRKFFPTFILMLVWMMSKGQPNTIYPTLFGQNAWSINLSSPGTDIDNYLPYLIESGAKVVRIGGIGPNVTIISETNLKSIVKKLNNAGITPIVQVSYIPTSNLVTQATAAAVLVKNLNTSSDPQHYVTYWSICNEPDQSYALSADAIEDYIKEYSQRMKRTVGTDGDPTIKIIGPDLATYYSTFSTYLDLTDNTKSNCNILPYIDVFAYHLYPFGDQNKTQSGNDIPSTRSNVIKFLSGLPSKAVRANSTNSNPLRDALSQIRTRLNNNGGTNVEIGITEANISFKNNVAADDNTQDPPGSGIYPYRNSVTEATDDLTGCGSNSFIAGQFWAEIMAESMLANDPTATTGTNAKIKFLNFWSIKEGQMSDGYVT